MELSYLLSDSRSLRLEEQTCSRFEPPFICSEITVEKRVIGNMARKRYPRSLMGKFLFGSSTPCMFDEDIIKFRWYTSEKVKRVKLDLYILSVHWVLNSSR